MDNALVVEGICPPGFTPVTNILLAEIVRRIVEGVHPIRIVLFGSYAYGNPSPDSDLDLLVIMDTDLRQTERFPYVSRLFRPRPCPMDILVRTPAEIENALEQKDSFIEEIIGRGKVLYESG